MSLTATSLDTVLVAAAEAAVGALPAESGWSLVAADPGDAPAPGAKARAVAAPVGSSGRLVLAVSAVLARSVQVGPPPAEDLLDSLLPAFRAAAEVLAGAGLGDTDTPVETGADGALRPGPGEDATAVALIDGDVHVATLALIGPVPAAAAEPDVAGPIAQHTFDTLTAGSPAAPVLGRVGPIELLSDVEMGVTVELGRTRMVVRDILELSPGSVIELDRAAGSPIDVMINGTLIARGEVVVIDEEFGVRITEVVGYDDTRLK